MFFINFRKKRLQKEFKWVYREYSEWRKLNLPSRKQAIKAIVDSFTPEQLEMFIFNWGPGKYWNLEQLLSHKLKYALPKHDIKKIKEIMEEKINKHAYLFGGADREVIEAYFLDVILHLFTFLI